MNKELLKYYIAKANLTQGIVSEKLGISRQAFCNKMIGRSPFKLDEICVLIYILNLSPSEVMDVFFAKVVNSQYTKEA